MIERQEQVGAKGIRGLCDGIEANAGTAGIQAAADIVTAAGYRTLHHFIFTFILTLQRGCRVYIVDKKSLKRQNKNTRRPV